MSDTICPSCGHSWPAGTAFCGDCAKTIPDSSPEPGARASAPVETAYVARGEVVEPTTPQVRPARIEEAGGDVQDADASARLDVIEMAPSTGVDAARATKERQVPRKLVFTLAGVVAVCVLGVGSFGVYAAVASNSPGARPATLTSAPTAPSSSASSAVPPWWKPTPVWSANGTALAVTSDGRYIAVSIPGGVQLRAAETGKVVGAIKEPGARIAAVTTGGEHGLIAWTAAAVHIWTPERGTSPAISLTNVQRVEVKGDGSPLVTSGSNEVAWAVTAAGLIAFSSPSKGAVPVAITSEGVAWASARQAVLLAGPDGTETKAIGLVAPEGAPTIGRWLGVAGGQMLVVWTDGSRQILTGTAIAGGASLQPTLLDPSDAGAALVPSADGKSAVLGALVLHLDNAAAAARITGFTATAAVDGLFLGTQNGKTVMVRPNGTKTTVPTGLTPVGVTRAGGLLASTATSTALFSAK